MQKCKPKQSMEEHGIRYLLTLSGILAFSKKVGSDCLIKYPTSSEHCIFSFSNSFSISSNSPSATKRWQYSSDSVLFSTVISARSLKYFKRGKASPEEEGGACFKQLIAFDARKALYINKQEKIELRNNYI